MEKVWLQFSNSSTPYSVHISQLTLQVARVPNDHHQPDKKKHKLKEVSQKLISIPAGEEFLAVVSEETRFAFSGALDGESGWSRFPVAAEPEATGAIVA
jgi:hypothetical protein